MKLVFVDFGWVIGMSFLGITRG